MIPILVLDLFTELIGTNWRIFHWKNNYLIYNLYLVLSTPLFLYLFSILLAFTRRQKQYYFGAAILLEVLVLYNFFFDQGPQEFNTYSNLLIQGPISCFPAWPSQGWLSAAGMKRPLSCRTPGFVSMP
ncbi:hypothetical protein ACQ86N_39250 [Puia sp. P3]|uniref:hypothetical protein n=1 Tax=Puia sp. P3 TaxID=3423952 RepID=UPI003D67ECFC